MIAARNLALEALRGMLEVYGVRPGATQCEKNPVHGWVDVPVNPVFVAVCEQARSAIAALEAETGEPVTCIDLQDLVSQALRKAWNLGQTYWQQADSEYTSQHRKADATRQKFDQLIEETRSAIEAAPGAPA